jgi:hypothetical protein
VQFHRDRFGFIGGLGEDLRKVPQSGIDLDLDAVPYVLVTMGAGDADVPGDQAVKFARVMRSAEGQARQDASAHVDVIVRDELAQDRFPPFPL